MRRFVTLAVLLFFTIPFGISISGCSKGSATVYCNGGDAGVIVGQATNITLQPQLFGISLNQGAIGQVNTPSATDCKANAVSIRSYIFGTSDMTLADINPASGALCAGSWNRNTGNGIPDFTTCNSTGRSGVAYITASGDGVTSNPIQVFVHPVVTSVVLGSPAASDADCATNPASNCSIDPATNSCKLTALPTSPPPYTGASCVSQGATTQIAARVFNGQNNISCGAGHITFTPLTASILTIDQNGIATAQQPGSTVINANTSQAGSSAGFFSTCPPVSVQLTAPGATTNPVVVNQNNQQPLTAVAKDANGTTLTGLALEFVSTAPTTIPSNSNGLVSPVFPGAAAITAICQPPTCNPAPVNLIGLFGNGKPVVSDPVQITVPGTSSTVLYIASTQSQYLVPFDFTVPTQNVPVRLPFVPNSMVISNDGSTIYLGSTTELIVLSALSNAVSAEYPAAPGVVLAVSPDGNSVVVTDPARGFVSLYSGTGSLTAQIGGVGTRAQWTPDSQYVYITTQDGHLLVHSTLNGWTTNATVQSSATDVAVTVPTLGAYLAGSPTTAVTNCANSTVTTTNGQTTVSNIFYPQSDLDPLKTDRLAATNDGNHIIGATATSDSLIDLLVSFPSNTINGVKVPAPCPAPGQPTQQFTHSTSIKALTGISPTAITGVLPTSDSARVFVTYTGTGGVIPVYSPATQALSNVALSGGTGNTPVAGVLSSDSSTLYLGSTDNLVHLVSNTASPAEISTIAPKLPGANGATAVPNLLVQRPRKTP